MGARASTILVSGASGVVGDALLQALRGQPTIGLVHQAPLAPAPGAEMVACDLERPRLGLTAARWRSLAHQVDVIVHSGALTTWGQPRERYQAINVAGTERVIELAQLAQAPIYLISTSFVHALERTPPQTLSAGNVVAPYISSKLLAEQLLAGSGVPHTIFRPTNLIGDSRTGASSRPQIVQALSEWICRGKAPYFPAHPGNLIDLVPLDGLSQAIAGAIRCEDLGSHYWVTMGADAMTVEQSLEVLAEHAAAHGREISTGPTVDPRQPLPIPLERVPATSRPFLKVMIDVSEVTHACGGVLPSSREELRARYGPLPAGDARAYRQSLDYWAAERAAATEYAGVSA